MDGRCWNTGWNMALVAKDVEIKEPGEAAHEEEASCCLMCVFFCMAWLLVLLNMQPVCIHVIHIDIR